MIKFAITLIAAAGLIFGLSACDGDVTTSGDSSSGDSNGSGFVLTPKGGMGIDLGGGMHLDPSTGGIGFGGIPIG